MKGCLSCGNEKSSYIFGVHKTGTTFIQKNLALNEAALKESGLCYLLEGRGDLWGHADFSEAVDADDSKALNGLMEKVDERTEDIILSSENFMFIGPEKLKHFRERLDQYEVTVIIYLRNIPDYLLSLWNTSTQSGRSLTIFEFWRRAVDQFDILDQTVVVNRFRTHC